MEKIKKEDKEDAENILAGLMREFKQIAYDLKFLHSILHESDGIPGEDFNKVRVAVPYLEVKFKYITGLVENYSRFLPVEKRKEFLNHKAEVPA